MIKISKIIGWLFVAFGVVNIIISSINISGIYLDITSLVCGYYLIKQNNTARKIISAIVGLGAVIQIIALLVITVMGLPKDASLTIFRSEIHLTSLLDAYLIFGFHIIMASLLFFILRSKKVLSEFENSANPV